MARPGLHNHPKFRRLVHLLQEPIPHVRGYLECLWDVAYENGEERIGDGCDVALASHYPGAPEKIVEALLTCGGTGRAGLIDRVEPSNGDGSRDGSCYAIHDLFDHAPEYVANRNRREAERRKEKVCAHCKETYRSNDPRSKYCSPLCRKAAWRDAGDAGNGSETDRNGSKTDGDGKERTSRSRSRSRSRSPYPKKESTAPKSKFVPPTLDEVRAYVSQKRYAIDPEHFLAHYEANGWVQSNGRPIKKWRAAVVTWQKNEAKRNPKAAPVQTVLSEFDEAHGTYTGHGFQYDTRSCDNPDCDRCNTKRHQDVA